MSESTEEIVIDLVEFASEPTVILIDHMGSDQSIVRSARVSVTGEQLEDGFPDPLDVFIGKLTQEESDERVKRATGLINYLMREKHGTPFEQTSMTFYVAAPIFVFREFHRHRVGFSYNERSGRYSKMEPKFWIPGKDRPLVNAGSAAKPEMVPGTEEQWLQAVEILEDIYEKEWEAYEKLLDLGLANEVARAPLGVGLYSEMYVTMNLRSALSFLTLRTHDKTAKHVSRPQKEIEDVARLIEETISYLYPVAYEKFNEHGRVAP